MVPKKEETSTLWCLLDFFLKTHDNLMGRVKCLNSYWIDAMKLGTHIHFPLQHEL